MKILAPLAALFLLSAVPATAADNSAPKVVAFNASVKVEVDAAGKPTKVEAPADLPDAIRGFIEKRVATWEYQPAKQDGVAAPATTYVNVGACAMPVAAGYQLGVDFKGNGPRLLGASGRLPPPIYPPDALRRGITGTFKVSYMIQPDGSTRLESVETLQGGNKMAKLFHPTLKAWAEGLRYEPERVNGRSVGTKMSFPVEFMIDNGRSNMTREEWRESYLAELQSRAIESKECMAATGQDVAPLPLALDSPVKITPRPAG